MSVTETQAPAIEMDQNWRWRRAVILLSLVFSVRYLWWRAGYTFNFESTATLSVSVLLFLAECYGVVSVALLAINGFSKGEAAPPQAGSIGAMRSVDVFVTIYNEPADILRRTLIGCNALDYPKDQVKVHVLDDGPREEIRELAQAMGVNYISRPDRKHAKAGNINNALARTSGEIVVIFDTDHVPVRSFLKETLGYFEDDKTAFVQLPHHFYNPDNFQRNLNLERAMGHEQDLFFHVIMPSRQKDNSVMFAGSSALLRRSALEDIGGIKVETAIEDTHTGMALQAKGWKGVYHPHILSAGLSPESYAGYLTQRGRWTRGGIQIFVLDNPLFKTGLSLRQRLHYFGSILYFFHALPRLVFLVAPLSFLMLSLNPLVAEGTTLVGYFLPHYLLGHLMLKTLGGRYRNPFWSDVYEAAGAFQISLVVLQTLVNPEKLIFRVTPKGENAVEEKIPVWQVLPHIVVLCLTVAGLIAATASMTFSGVYENLDAFALSTGWALYNIILLACAVEATRERRRFRKDFRLSRSMPAVVDTGERVLEGMTSDLSDSGASVELKGRWYLPHDLTVTITAPYGEQVSAKVELARTRFAPGGKTVLGLRFTEPTRELQDAVVRLAFSPAASWSGVEWPGSKNSIKSLEQIVRAAFWHRLNPLRSVRNWPRAEVNIPCGVAAEKTRVAATIRDISAEGACLTGAGAPAPGTRLSLDFEIGDGTRKVLARVVRSQGRGTGKKVMVRFTEPSRVDLSPLANALTAQA